MLCTGDALIVSQFTGKFTRGGSYHESLRSALLVREQAIWNAQFACPIFQNFNVVEVAREPYVPENRLLQALVDAIEHAIHLEDCELLIDVARRGLHPKHVLLPALHQFGELLH